MPFYSKHHCLECATFFAGGPILGTLKMFAGQSEFVIHNVSMHKLGSNQWVVAVSIQSGENFMFGHQHHVKATFSASFSNCRWSDIFFGDRLY